MSSNTSETRKYEMPSHLRLGFDRNGNIDMENWERELIIKSKGFFKDLTEAFEDNQPRTWMDKNAKFIYYKKVVDSSTGAVTLVESKFPKKNDESKITVTQKTRKRSGKTRKRDS